MTANKPGPTLDGAKALKAAHQAKPHLDALLALFKELAKLDPDDRAHSAGKLRDDEPAAMRAILDGTDLRPGYFGDVADLKARVHAARADLDAFDALKALEPALEEIERFRSDTMKLLGARVHPLTTEVWDKTKAHLATDTSLKTLTEAAGELYGKAAAARAKKAEKAKKTADKPNAPGP